MDTVLGLSMTSTGIAWVLLEGQDADAKTVDHDHFAVVADVATDGDISTHQAAVRGARAIASASGHRVDTVYMTWSADVGAKAELLRKSLLDMGFARVTTVRMADAARTWTRETGPDDEIDGCAVCVVESSAVTVVSVLGGNVRTAMTHMRESADGLARWLTGFFDDEEMQPRRLYLIGARGDLELISGPLEQALGVPVVSSDDVQLALARGAALSGPAISVAAPPPPAGESRQLRSRRRLSPHGRAAMLLGAGVIALFAFGPELARWDSPEARADPSAETSAVEPAAAVTDVGPSMSVHAVPSRPVVPIVVKEVIAKPVAAPAMSTPLPSTSDVAEGTAVAPEVAAQQVTETVEPQVEAVQEPPAAVAIAQAEPASPQPAPQNPVAPPPAFVPAPDPVQLALSPLFGGLP
ncbi:hypothetical protein H7I77_20980 [Mycolicibacterium novocastrense]|uniref:DUF7159 domain-containing protein n=1 Tax=Mycolicibacterium novocastrense TaxID=59813 RepID=A0AAW5SNN9_MYCNV|nr:hypothetical protein [Mycolicibacterium novocastrense]MCV7025795.1 hypothetical protein [Mycolicibacterium novocastrense]GAT07325.1 uncharacterized protein RMCN_0458 [Mycolicibacterium novocastrense]